MNSLQDRLWCLLGLYTVPVYCTHSSEQVVVPACLFFTQYSVYSTHSSEQVVVLAWSMMMVFVVALAIIELLVVVELLGGQLIQVHLGAAAMLDVLT